MPQLAFFHLSTCQSAEMTDGHELRADGGCEGPSTSILLSDSQKMMVKEYVVKKKKGLCQRMMVPKGLLLITQKGVASSSSGFLNMFDP